MLTQEVLDAIRKLEKKIRKVDCCNDCVEIDVTCDNGEVPVWNTALAKWECGTVSGGVTSISESGETELTGDVTLSEGEGITITQTGNDIEIASHAPVTLNADTPTQNAANLSGQVLQLVPATSTEYGVVKLEDLFAQFERVDTYADLPDPTLHTDEYYHVVNSQGSAFWPGWIGGTFYSKGFYYSDGSAWEFVGEVPYQASQADVDAGIITDQFVSPATLKSNLTNTRKETIGFTSDGAGSAIATGKVKGYVTVPYAATISGWNIMLDTGTCTVKVWKIATGTAVPTVANVINTSGVSISSGTAVHSSVVTDFTTTSVAANDIFAFDITALSSATQLTFQLELSKT